MKLENLVMPLLFGLGATALACGINKEQVKSGMEAVATYLVAVPIGVTAGYVLERFDDFMKSKGYDFSGSIAKP